MKKKDKRRLRKKIAEQVGLKLMYIGACPNERDIILNVILSKKDKYLWNTHCENECGHKHCEVKKWFLEHNEKQPTQKETLDGTCKTTNDFFY